MLGNDPEFLSLRGVIDRKEPFAEDKRLLVRVPIFAGDITPVTSGVSPHRGENIRGRQNRQGATGDDGLAKFKWGWNQASEAMEYHLPWATTKQSSTRIPSKSPDCCRVRWTARSSGDGVTSPDG